MIEINFRIPLLANGTRLVHASLGSCVASMRVFRMTWMLFSLHCQQYQSSQLFIHWSVRLVVPHTEHLAVIGSGLVDGLADAVDKEPPSDAFRRVE